MSSERYEILQDDLEALLERTEASLAYIAKKSNSDPNELKSGLNRCQRQVDEGRGFLAEMEREARSAPLNFRSEMLTKVRSLRETIANVQSEIRKKESELSREKYSRVHRSDENDLTQEEMLRQQVRLLDNSIYYKY